ncbi:3-hydroxyacyl-CoA dehydrogenase NAD-binding domain-containing protein [Neorhizobium sp. DAR64872/K0K18]|uniref:3-hydroxyacyl-CoA dehydrogenase NAD-binding domain-containing protein n=1 Tax=Neorhizobium sp. DAR64872/K0K18 TaxID=3421958 RepID=UPI003D271A86
MDFFNPAPIMKLVEIVAGIMTSSATASLIRATATNWGKLAVHTKSTPDLLLIGSRVSTT